MIDKVKQLYKTSLRENEEILVVVQATALGVGRNMAMGATIGALIGWLAAINLDGALLPMLVIGALGGEAVAYVVSERTTRRKEGPGTIHLIVVLTDQRLLTMRRYAWRRRRILRSYELHDLLTIDKRQYPIGQLHRIEVTLTDETTTGFIAQRDLDIPVISDPGSG